MPDIFDQAAAEIKSPPKAQGDVFDQAASELRQSKQTTPPGYGTAFAKGLWASTVGGLVDTFKQEMEPATMISEGAQKRDPKQMAKGILYSAAGPGAPILKGMIGAQVAEGKKAKDATSTAGKIGHSAAAAVPVAGPLLANITEQVQSGDVAGAAGSVTGIVLPMLLGKIVPSEIHIPPGIKLSPEDAAAIQEAKARGIPISAGQQSGSKLLQNLEQKMQYIPGSAGVAQRFMDTQKEAGVKAFRKIPSEVTAYQHKTVAGKPQAVNLNTDPTGAGQIVVDRVVGERMRSLRSLAARDYDSIHKQLDWHRENVQPKELERAMAKYHKDLADYEQSKDYPKRPPVVPEPAPSAAPVDMVHIRGQLKSLYDELSQSLPEAQKASSPGYTALKRIVEGSEKTKDALTVDKDLSAIKSIVRNGTDGYAGTTSQRYASRSIAAMEAQIEKSLSDVNPNLLYRLKRARSAVKEYHRNNELISKLAPPGRSPIEAFNRLTVSGGRQLPEIMELKRIAPNALNAVGKTYLQGLVNTVTSEGGLNRTASILNKWKALDPRVRRAVFGPEISSGLDRFFLAAKRLNLDLNPSGTAKWLAMSRHMGETGAALTALLTGHPGALASFGGSMLAMNRLSRVMFTPSGTRLLTQAVSIPVGTRIWFKTMTQLEALSESEQGRDGQVEALTASPPDGKTAIPPGANGSVKGDGNGLNASQPPASRGTDQPPVSSFDKLLN